MCCIQKEQNWQRAEILQNIPENISGKDDVDCVAVSVARRTLTKYVDFSFISQQCGKCCFNGVFLRKLFSSNYF